MINLGPGQENHAILLQRVLDDPAQLGLLTGQQCLPLVQEHHLNAEGREQVPELAADGAAANDDHARGQLRQAHRLNAGDRLHFVQPRDVGPCGLAASSDQDALAAQHLTGDPKGVFVLERSLPLEQGDALPFKFLGGLRYSSLPDNIFLAGHHLGPVEADGSGLDAEGTGLFQEGVDLGGPEQRLGGHAGTEGAVTPWLVHLDHGHGMAVCPQLLGGCGSRRTASEDNRFKLAGGFRRGIHTLSPFAVQSLPFRDR